MLQRCQIQQVPAVTRLIHGQCVVQPVRKHRLQTLEVRFEARCRLSRFAGRAGMRIDAFTRGILKKTDFAQGIRFHGNQRARLLVEEIALGFDQPPLEIFARGACAIYPQQSLAELLQ